MWLFHMWRFSVYDYFSDADDCMTLIGIPLLFKEKTENMISFGDSDANEHPVLIKVAQNILSMDTDMFSVIIEGTTIFKCEHFLSL